MPGMVNMDHIGMYDVLQAGTARTDATLAQALAEIGSQVKRLVLSNAGDGIWTFNSPWTIPANVILEVPYGSKVAGTGAGTINGGLLTYDNAWNLGPPLAGFGSTPIFQTNSLQTVFLVAGELTATPQALVHIRGNTGRPASLMVEEGWDATTGSHGGGATINWKQVNNVRASLGCQFGSTDLTLNMQGGVRFIIAGSGANQVGIGLTNPTHLLQLGLADAYMPGGGPWLNSTSDARLKKNMRPFTMGLAVALQLAAKYYEYNGLGETIDDGKEYIGFVADDIVDIVPHMVGHDDSRKLYPTDETTTDFYTTNEGSLAYILLNAVKEQQATIVEQRTLIDDLTARLEALEALTGERATHLEAAAHTHSGSGNAGSPVPYTPPGR